MLGPLTILLWMKHFERLFGQARNICEIGAQEISCREHKNVLRDFAHSFPKGRQQFSEQDIDRLADGALASDLYRGLGLSYKSIDITAARDSIVLDLNYDDAPRDCMNAYDLVTNIGTTEHVANQLNAFKVIHDLTKPGGYMYHELPYTGFLTHGLVNYTPKFFWMLCKSNFYEYVEMLVFASHVVEPMHNDVLSSARFFVSQGGNSLEQVLHAEGAPDPAGFACQDSGILCIMRKQFDAPFVPPVDGEVGKLSRTGQKRYWSLTDPKAYETLVKKRK